MRRFSCFLLLFSLLLGSCQTPATPAAISAATKPLPAPTNTVEIKNTPTALPTPTPKEPPLTLQPCTVKRIKAECGYLHVPEDRSNPNSRILDLHIVVVRAYGNKPAPDALFYIVGGPGVPVTAESIVANAQTYMFWTVNAQRDLVFLDQRGTNDQHRLACDFPTFAVDVAPQSQVDDWMKACLSKLEGDPRFYLTLPAMQDLDAARAALGYDKIDLYGISYGAAAAQVYMRMFPEHVRTVILDHSTALDLPFFQVFPRASQSALDQVFAYCEQDEKCQAAYPDLRSEWQALLKRLEKGPVVTSYVRAEGEPPAQVDIDDLVDGIHQLMYRGEYSPIPSLIHVLGTQEDWTPIVKSFGEQDSSSDGGEDDRFLFMANMIFCFEPAWGDEPDAIARLNPGTYITDLQVERAKIQQKYCAALPKPDPSLIYGPGKPAPLSALMFNSLLDPQNPPEHMDLALKEFTQSRVVVEPTEGHEPNLGTYYASCRLNIMTQYIEQGSVDGLDTTCMQKIKPSFVTGDQ